MSGATTQSTAQYKYVFGPAVFDASLFELKVNNKPKKIERRPLEVLEALLKHVDEVMTKDELLDIVWSDVVTVENVVANAITKLRKALGPDIAGRIVTHPRIGYRFSGPVERLAIGRKLVSSLNLEQGASVSGRQNYKLETQISAAPSREVWRARHSKTKKSRIFKFANDGHGLASLKREVTLFRLLKQSTKKDLPVAEILDWNFASEPFYIECDDAGIDLKTWSKTKGKLQGLSDSERIKLAHDIAKAVSHIHDAGVLHRDLKPTNILVTGDIENHQPISVRLIDFGSGNIRSRQALTDLGISPMGFTRELDDDTQLSTPLYLAPEIVRGQTHSIQSDIYSLGIIIYQILSGDIDKPMATGWRNEINDPLLIDDIEMATQGMIKDRTDSAAILRDSLSSIDQRRSELKISQALETRAAEAEMALKRSQARRPWIYATGTALTLGLCASLFFGFNAQNSKLAAEQSAQRAEATSEFLKDVLISADPRTPGVGPDATVASSLERAEKLAEERFASDIGLQIGIKETIATVYSGLSDPKEVQSYEDIFERAKNHYGEKSDQARLAKYRIAHALIRQSKYDEAEAIITELDNWPVSNNSTIIESALQAKGRIKLVQIKYAESIPFNQQLNELLSAKSNPDLDVLHTVRIDLAQSYSRISGREEEAVDVLRTLLEPPFSDGGVDDWRMVNARSLLGIALVYVLEYEEAEPLIKQSLQEQKNIYGEDSPNVLEALGHLGQLYAGTNRRLESAQIFGEMRELACRKFGEENIQCAAYMTNEGINYIDVGDYKLAADKLRKARPVIHNILGIGSPFDQGSSFHLASALMEMGQTQQAGQLIQGLEIDKLTAGAPGARWDLLLGALQARYEIRTNYSNEANENLRSIVNELISIEAEETLIARASSDLKN